MKNQYKIVFFERYCNSCKYEKRDEGEDPCRNCLNSPVNEHSHKPVEYRKK